MILFGSLANTASSNFITWKRAARIFENEPFYVPWKKLQMSWITNYEKLRYRGLESTSIGQFWILYSILNTRTSWSWHHILCFMTTLPLQNFLTNVHQPFWGVIWYNPAITSQNRDDANNRPFKSIQHTGKMVLCRLHARWAIHCRCHMM